MKLYITLTRKVLVVILCTLLLFLGFYSRITAANSYEENGKTNSDRILFLENIGCVAQKNPVESGNITIPNVFSDVYENYNKIQKEAGFDLSPFKGEECTLYKYRVISLSGNKSENTFANLIIYKDRIIGGDIQSVAIDGEMLPLKKENGKTTAR